MWKSAFLPHIRLWNWISASIKNPHPVNVMTHFMPESIQNRTILWACKHKTQPLNIAYSGFLYSFGFSFLNVRCVFPPCYKIPIYIKYFIFIREMVGNESCLHSKPKWAQSRDTLANAICSTDFRHRESLLSLHRRKDETKKQPRKINKTSKFSIRICEARRKKQWKDSFYLPHYHLLVSALSINLSKMSLKEFPRSAKMFSVEKFTVRIDKDVWMRKRKNTGTTTT